MKKTCRFTKKEFYKMEDEIPDILISDEIPDILISHEKRKVHLKIVAVKKHVSDIELEEVLTENLMF